MAQYVFECTVCKHEQEAMQKVNDPFPACEKCAAETRRMIGGGVQAKFAGGGWASDGYCSRTPAMRELQRKMKNAVSGRYRPDGVTLRSTLRGTE